MTNKSGFTLAEVLITLGIIGVVAAMTIPTLMNSTGEAQFSTGLKKMVSVLNQAITMNVALNSSDFSALTAGNSTTAGSVANMFSSRMNVLENVSNGAGNSARMGTPFSSGANYTLILSDGMAITFPTAAANCTLGATANTPANVTSCIMTVDVNGIKPPNRLSLATAANTTLGIFDEYNLYFFNQQVVPADAAANYVLYK